jgi:hypothetical protein
MEKCFVVCGGTTHTTRSILPFLLPSPIFNFSLPFRFHLPLLLIGTSLETDIDPPSLPMFSIYAIRVCLQMYREVRLYVKIVQR